MKKLNKLVISPEKIMKNEELINLHGGYGANCCTRSKDGEHHTWCYDNDDLLYLWKQAWIAAGWNVHCGQYYYA